MSAEYHYEAEPIDQCYRALEAYARLIPVPGASLHRLRLAAIYSRMCEQEYDLPVRGFVLDDGLSMLGIPAQEGAVSISWSALETLGGSKGETLRYYTKLHFSLPSVDQIKQTTTTSCLPQCCFQ